MIFEYFDVECDVVVWFGWCMFGVKLLFEEVLEVVWSVDVVVFVGGLIGDVEGEEMMVNYLGFVGGDCIDLCLFVI